ncbi:enoyl-CoA hydratase family protein [Streptacidiphilus sp. PAMC 29251]
MTELVHCAVTDQVATITLDSPHNRNALSRQLMQELAQHLDAAGKDPAVRAVVLTHTGKVFCAGADLSEAGSGSMAQDTARVTDLLRAVVELPKPVLARVNGHVRAGGMGIVGACDIAIASDAATFAFTEARVGVAPAIISLTTLDRMQSRAASRYYLTGETFDSAAAAACGLITLAASADELDAAVAAVLDQVRQTSPQGSAETKLLLTAATRRQLAAHGAEMTALSARLFATAEAQEGIHAFLERRVPSWRE